MMVVWKVDLSVARTVGVRVGMMVRWWVVMMVEMKVEMLVDMKVAMLVVAMVDRSVVTTAYLQSTNINKKHTIKKRLQHLMSTKGFIKEKANKRRTNTQKNRQTDIMHSQPT